MNLKINNSLYKGYSYIFSLIMLNSNSNVVIGTFSFRNVGNIEIKLFVKIMSFTK